MGNYRLSRSEFELLLEVLKAVENQGNNFLLHTEFNPAPLTEFFGEGRVRVIDTTAAVQRLRDKIKRIAADYNL